MLFVSVLLRNFPYRPTQKRKITRSRIFTKIRAQIGQKQYYCSEY